MPQHLRLLSKTGYTARDHGPSVPRRLWIDAICISQADSQGRSEQVRFMYDIYKGAKRTLVWLGKADDDSDLAIDTIMFLDTRVGIEPFRPLLKLHGSSGLEHIDPHSSRE